MRVLILPLALALGLVTPAWAGLQSPSAPALQALADLTRPEGQKHFPAGYTPQEATYAVDPRKGTGVPWRVVDSPPPSVAAAASEVVANLIPAKQKPNFHIQPLAQQYSAASSGQRSQPQAAAERQTGSTFSPINPPSFPLAVRGPYLSAWLPSGTNLDATPPNVQGNGGYLAGQYPSFWTTSYGADGEFRLGWSGFIRINGTSYQWMGASFGNIVKAGPNAKQISAKYTSTRTIFTFEAAGVKFNVTFLTPITPDDYVRQSLPLSYLHFELDAKSAKGSSVQLYTEIDERWITGHDYDYQNFPYHQTFINTNGTSLYLLERNNPQVYTEFRQRAEWGATTYAARNHPTLSSRNNNNIVTQREFLDTGKVTFDHGPVGGPDNSFAFAVNFSAPGVPQDALFAVGLLREPYVNYVRPVPGAPGKSYQEDRYGYWQTAFPNFNEAVSFFINDFPTALAGAIKFDEQIRSASKAVVGGGSVGDKYAAITELSVRQALATIEITVSKDAQGALNKSDTLIFLKEISSNGDMSTVDVIFPLFPLLSYINPELLRDTLEPIFLYDQSGLYPNKWATHDIGTYPNGRGYPDGNDEPMQVEESGNMILMALHYAQLVGGSRAKDYLRGRYAIMQQWASYLIEDSLIPSYQLSTDDFAGPLANQTDLAIKGIEGISAMGYIADLLGEKKDASMYHNTSLSYVQLWANYSISNDGSHLKLAYQDDASWGTLYNLFADRLLNLRLVPKAIYDVLDKWYPTKVQKYGVPLDSRHLWAKTDWQMFAAGTAASTSVRNLFINKLYSYASNGLTDNPWSDLFETNTGDTPKEPQDPAVHFLARPVVGGHFLPLAVAKANAVNGITAKNPYAYGKPFPFGAPGKKPSSTTTSTTTTKAGKTSSAIKSSSNSESESESKVPAAGVAGGAQKQTPIAIVSRSLHGHGHGQGHASAHKPAKIAAAAAGHRQVAFGAGAAA